MYSLLILQENHARNYSEAILSLYHTYADCHQWNAIFNIAFEKIPLVVLTVLTS
jgi:hypothetical protein